MCSVTVAGSCHSWVEPQTCSRSSSRLKTCSEAVARKGQEIEFLGGEIDGAAVDLDPVGGPVDDETVVLDLGDGLGRMAPAQDGPDAGFELGQGAGLHHVVVGPEVEDPDAFGLLRASGEDDHREGPVAAEPGEDLVAVDAGQAQIQEDQVVLAQAGLPEGGGTVDRLAHLVAHPLEEQPGGRPAGLVVFGDEDGPLVVGHCHKTHPYTFVVRRLRLEGLL